MIENQGIVNVVMAVRKLVDIYNFSNKITGILIFLK